MVVTTKMNSASLPPLRPDSEQLVDLHVYQVPEEVWNLKYRSAYNEVINETISIGFVRVWPELSIWNLRTELLNQLGPDCVPGEFVYVRSVGRCLTKVKGRQELELKVKAFLPPRNFAPEIFILEAPQDVPDTALIEASKQETATREDEGASSMEIDGEDDKDEEETNAEKGKDRRLDKSLKWSQKEKKKVEFKMQNKPINKLKGIMKAVPAGNNVKPSSSIKQGRTAPKSSRRGQVTKSLTMNELKSLQEKEIIAKRSRPPLKNGIVAATLRDTKGRKTVPSNKNQRNRLVSKPVLSAEAKVRIRPPEVKNMLRSKVIKTKIGDEKASAGIKKDKPLVEKPTARRIPKPLKYTDLRLRKLAYNLQQRFPATNGKMRIQGPSEHPYSVNAPKTTNSYHSSVNLRPASYQPRMALLPSSSFPPHPPNNYSHSQIPQSLPQPHSSQSRQFKTPNDNQVPPPLRHLVQSHSRQSFPTRRMPVGTSSNPSWEGRGGSGPFSEGLPSQGYTLSQRTYSQTSEGTLPEFLSLPESQQSANVPSYNSTDPLNGQSSVNTLENINETDSLFGVPIDGSKSLGNKDPSITNLGQHHNPIHDLVSSLPSEIPLAHSVGLSDTTGYPHGDQDSSSAPYKPVPGDTKIGNDSPRQSSQDGEALHNSNDKLITLQNHPNSDFISANTPLSISNLSPNHHKINKPSILPVFSSPAPTHPVSDAEPHHSDTTPSDGRDYSPEQQESPRKGGRQETFTKHTNSDSGLGEQTPEEISERIHRENHGPKTTSKDIESSRQPHYENDSHLPIGRDRIQEHEDPNLRHRSERQEYFQDSPRGGYQNNQNYDSPRTQRPPQYEEGPGPDQRPMENYTGGYSHRDPSGPGQGHTQQPGGSYEDDESPRGVYQQSRGPGRSMGQGNHDHRYQDERYEPQGEHSSGFQESTNAWEEGGPHERQDGGIDDARNTQKAMAYLQLNSDHAPSPKLYPRLPSSDSPSEASSSAVSSSNPEKQRIMSQMKEEQQARLDMEKIREELIKKAKSLQGKTIDRRKKDGMTEMLQANTDHELEARDYWKKRYYDEKKKTPGLEDQVAKLANQVQLQNRKLMSHLEGKGAKAPKGPPSKKMDHKIQIFKHQYDLDDVKRQVDNARMKLGTEIKLRTQAETELRILKSEVTQKKINVTLKRGKQLQAVQKSGGKLTSQTPRPTGR